MAARTSLTGVAGIITGFLSIHFFFLWMEISSCNAVEKELIPPDSSLRSLNKQLTNSPPVIPVDSPQVDTVLYNRLLQHLVYEQPSARWPVKTGYPLPDAIIPFRRIIRNAHKSGTRL